MKDYAADEGFRRSTGLQWRRAAPCQAAGWEEEAAQLSALAERVRGRKTPNADVSAPVVPVHLKLSRSRWPRSPKPATQPR